MRVCMPVVPALRRLMQKEGHKFEANLVYSEANLVYSETPLNKNLCEIIFDLQQK